MPRKSLGLKTYSIRLTPQSKKVFEKLATAQNRDWSQLVREAMDHYLAKLKGKRTPNHAEREVTAA